MSVVPTKFLERMSAEDRATLGKAGALPSEIVAKLDAKRETALQSRCAAYLRHRYIWFEWKATHRRSTGTPGCPDFLFCINGKFCAIECKSETGKLDDDQEKARDAILAGGGQWALVRTDDEFRNQLTAWGAPPATASDDLWDQRPF